MRCLWRAASLHRHGESLAATAPDLTVLRRHLHSLRKRGLKPSCRTMQTARVVTPRKLKEREHRFYCCKGNTTGDPDFVDLVAKTDWILLEARADFTKPELRSLFLRGLTSGSWLVTEPYEGCGVWVSLWPLHIFHLWLQGLSRSSPS